MRADGKRMVAVGLIIGLLGAGGVSAALKKYSVRQNRIQEFGDSSPPVELVPHKGPVGYTVIDSDGPVLKKFATVFDVTDTFLVPDLGGLIFISSNTTEGPQGEFPGTGSTETTIAWGLVTGWTQTGVTWCNASPSFLCDLTQVVNQETVFNNSISSTFYDFGTWTFHGTGYTATPVVHNTGLTGNNQHIYSGWLVQDGTVPALPLLGFAVLGASVVLAARTAARRRGGHPG